MASERLDSSLLPLIDTIYRAGTTGEWQSVVEATTKHFDTSYGTLFITDAALERPFAPCYTGWTEQDKADWLKYCGASDPWFVYSRDKLKAGDCYLSQQICPADVLERSECYQRFYAPRAICWGMGGVFRNTPAGLSLICVMRAEKEGPYTEAHLAQLRTLVPHLMRAADIYTDLHSLRSEIGTLKHAVNRLPYAFLVLDAVGTVLLSNPKADQILGERDGLQKTRNRLRATAAATDKELQWLLSQANIAHEHAAAASTIAIDRPSGKSPLWIEVSPLAPGIAPLKIGNDAPSIMVTIQDRAMRSSVNTKMLSDIYGLTTAEVRLAERIAQGESLVAAAHQLSISAGTARTHLKRIFSKTQTSRQAEFVALISRHGNKA